MSATCATMSHLLSSAADTESIGGCHFMSCPNFLSHCMRTWKTVKDETICLIKGRQMCVMNILRGGGHRRHNHPTRDVKQTYVRSLAENEKPQNRTTKSEQMIAEKRCDRRDFEGDDSSSGEEL